MKFFIALSLLVVATSAGTLPGFLPRWPLMPASFSDELEGRITNGEVAAPGQFPYQVAVLIKSGDNISFCGGSILSEFWVLTAAHCADAANAADSVVVVAGANKINEHEKEQKRISVDKKNIIAHEGWNPSTLTNDIALIHLPVPLSFNKYIQKAELPKEGQTFVGEKVVASGWGKDSDSATSVSPVLRFVESTVITRASCQNYYLGAVPAGDICMSGKDGKSICDGDSGGPLVHKEGGKNIVIGATSFGIDLGCEKGWPGVFTSTASYLGWIAKKSGIRS